MFKLKVGDEIIVRSGREKGKKSKIDKVYPNKNMIIAAGLNIYKRHKKATANTKAGIYEIARPINIAKIALICPKCSKPTRIHFSFEGKTKQRICAKCKGVLK